MKFVLITGNPVDGFVFTGPFDTHLDAEEAGERVHEADWWVADLVPAEETR